jgi:hypothetical protein
MTPLLAKAAICCSGCSRTHKKRASYITAHTTRVYCHYSSTLSLTFRLTATSIPTMNAVCWPARVEEVTVRQRQSWHTGPGTQPHSPHGLGGMLLMGLTHAAGKIIPTKYTQSPLTPASHTHTHQSQEDGYRTQSGHLPKSCTQRKQPAVWTKTTVSPV